MRASDADVEFGALLKTARDEAGLTTAAIAKSLPVARESADRYMRGQRRPDKDVVVRWEQICGLEPGSLIDAYAALPSRQVPSIGVADRPREDPVSPAQELSDRGGPGTADAEGLPATAAHHRRAGRRTIAVFAIVVAGLVTALAAGALSAGDRGRVASASADGSVLAPADRYSQSVADVCETLDRSAREVAAMNRRLSGRLRRAKSTLGQRNVLLETQNVVVELASLAFSRFAGLDPAGSRRARHRATVARWERNLDRSRRYAQRLDRAGDRAELVKAIEYLSRTRPALHRDSVGVNVGLVSLSDGRCHRERPPVSPVVTLPSGRGSPNAAPGSVVVAPRHVAPQPPQDVAPPPAANVAPPPAPNAAPPPLPNAAPPPVATRPR